MVLKVLRYVFPIYFWILISIGLVISFLGYTNSFTYTIFNLVFILLFIRLGIVIHEIGHLVFAKLAGGHPRRIILGRGHEVTRFTLFNVKLIINKFFISGLAFANFSSEIDSKYRRLLFVLGGPLTNILLAYLCYKIFGYHISFMSGTNALDVSSAFILSNALLGIISLIPYYTIYQGLKLPTDGLYICLLLFKKFNKSTVDYDNLLLANEKIEDKAYADAIRLYMPYLDVEKMKPNVQINIAVCYLKMGKLNESFKYLEDCINAITKDDNKHIVACAHNNMACLKLVMDIKEGVDFHSKKAYFIDNKNEHFIGTRASVLIEMGKIKQGLKLLKPLVDFNFPNHAVIFRAMYMYYGLILSEEPQKALKYFDFVEKHKDKFEVHDNILWDLLLHKLNSSSITPLT